MTKLQDARFRKANFAASGEKAYNFDPNMLRLLMAMDGSKTVLQIARELKMDMAVFKDTFKRLYNLKLIEEVKETIVYADKGFLSRLMETLVNLVGPLGEMLAEETAKKMNFQASKIPKDSVADFIYEIAKEIPGDKQQAEFRRLMLEEMKEME